MSFPSSVGRLALFVALVSPLGACVSASGDTVAGRAAEFASTVSRASACRAGAPRANTLDRYLAAERARGANDDEIATARSTYVTVSEAEMINQSIRPTPCGVEERAALREKMQRIRAGSFENL